MKKVKEVELFSFIWVIIGGAFFIKGIIDHDWFYLIVGFLWNFEELQIVHWQGMEYKTEL